MGTEWVGRCSCRQPSALDCSEAITRQLKHAGRNDEDFLAASSRSTVNPDTAKFRGGLTVKIVVSNC
jgi:hypothetical protein